MHIATLAVHSGQRPDPHTGAVNAPVYLTSTYEFEGIGKLRGDFDYSRTGNPNRHALETVLAALEGGKHGLAFASGQAATTAVLSLLRPGDEIVTVPNIYGGTFRIFDKVIVNYGISVRNAPDFTPEAISGTLTDKTVLVWIESPTNPLMTILDIAAVAEKIQKQRGTHKPLLVVDNTFASPALQNPLALGADIVTHSCTKYIGGHSDLIGGAVIVNDERLWQEIKFYQNAAGAVPSPLDCYLQLRGIRTLPLRMTKHGENARRAAEFLRQHKKVARVYFPGFEDFPGHAVAAKQMKGMTGVVSFELKTSTNDVIGEVDKFVRKLRLIILAESLGGVESLVCHPATMTHAALPPEDRRRAGIGDNLIRLSLGIEEAQDLIEDLKQALE
ncbi:MAG: PLP-dependent aspartate aminotransferase family protein [Planctomycetaceae bacterium]|jgi:cystathionine beta-lyase/cystathionine gamma-synthase|nr:PLP-dependent aspartate aminotransferase family protein [Planctomycetaceae bacterium]